ncbi:MAG: sugar ABC transporter ATP-binding protein [Peptostreptococcaceae bacterium]|nr:sugar ABC transporter ATP-binding protein [Peptostreptococcaceae bacterium]
MLLEMINIDKSFFNVKVLDDVSFRVDKGEIHALLGENGAGKSTLMNILGGVHEKDRGTIILDNEKIEKINTKIAPHLGIAFVHQELNLFNDLRVFENIFLREEITNKFGQLNKQKMISEVEKLFGGMGVDIDPTVMVSELDTSNKQLLEIAKALRKDAKLFILDEPTTALGNLEIENLFSIIRTLKKQGKSFIFISHKMPEIFQIADKYTVLRNGAFVGTGKISDVTPEEVTRMMVGDCYDNRDIYVCRELNEPILELEHFSGKGFQDVNIKVNKGEVLSLTGLQGSGCSELMQCIFGCTKSTSGNLKINDKIVSGGIRSMMKNKVGMIASNRKENAVLKDLPLLENCYISEHTLSWKRQKINKQNEIEKYNILSKKLNIKANSYKDLIVSLSGGNQQKVMIARWLNTDAEIFLLDNPTQGIDVGAKSEIYKLIVKLSEQGKTIIMNTQEIFEIQKISDRCAVFYHSRLQVVLDRKDINEETVMLYATNANRIGENQNGKQ